MKLSELGEDAVVTRLTRSLRLDSRVRLGAGDDCAVLDSGQPGRALLFKTDSVVEGIRHSLQWAAIRDDVLAG